MKIKKCLFLLLSVAFPLFAHAAEAMNHHPDLFVGWRKVTVRLSTHSAGGLTLLDLDLARRADAADQGTVSPEPV